MDRYIVRKTDGWTVTDDTYRVWDTVKSEAICTCFAESDANRICDLLNADEDDKEFINAE